MDDAARIAQLEAELRQACEEIGSLRQRETDLVGEVERQTKARIEAQERQGATAEVIRMIASSSTDAQPVLDAVVQGAMQLSDSVCVVLGLLDGDQIHVVARGGTFAGAASLGDIVYLTERRGATLALLEQRTIHVPDTSDPLIRTEFPDSPRHRGITRLNVPLVHNGVAIGVLSINRDAVRPYSEREIALVETFADQAAVAVANARLFEELQRSNRQTTEALEQQTATAEVLRVIASSPTDLQSVADALVESVHRLCGADGVTLRQVDGAVMRLIATSGEIGQARMRVGDVPMSRASLTGRAILDADILNVRGLPGTGCAHDLSGGSPGR